MILAAVVDPGWTKLLWTAGLFLVIEPLIGQVVEPLVYGRSTGLSPVAVVVSATFWTALWGPIGLVLSTPLTVCLVVLGRYVDRFQFLEVMLGDRPPLAPPELFYQRMLAGDPAEAVDKAEEFLKERSLVEYYDDVALPGLKLAQNDMLRGALDQTHSEKIRAAVLEVVDDLADHEDMNPRPRETHDAEAMAAVESVTDDRAVLPVLAREALAGEWQAPTPVLCVAGRGPLDEAAAAMLAQLLGKHGLQARVESADAIATSNVLRLDASGTALVFLSHLDTSSVAHMRYTVRRLRRRLPHVAVVLGCWMTDADQESVRDLSKADAAVTRLQEALAYAVRSASGRGSETNLESEAGVAPAAA
jgi:hypothetical protein